MLDRDAVAPGRARWSPVALLRGPAGHPPQWAMVGNLTVGLLAGAAAGLLLHPHRGAMLAALTGGAVAAAGGGVSPLVAVRIAAWTAGVGCVASGLAFTLSGHPVPAALAVALVAVLTSVAAGAGPVAATLATLGSYLYVLTAAIGQLTGLAAGVPLGSGLARIVIGAAAGLAAVIGRALVRRHPVRAAVAVPSPLPAMVRSLRTVDQHTRDGIRRAVPLAIGIFAFERTGTRDAYWVFLATFVVLLPSGKPAPKVAASRVTSTVLGVVLLGPLALAVPHRALLWLAVAALVLGLAYQPSYPVTAGALTALGAVLLAGAPSGRITAWAAHRVVDTLGGCALALAGTYLLWPRDPSDAGVPTPSDRVAARPVG